MQYAIVEVAGKQFWMEPGKYYDLNLISDFYSDRIIFNRILLTHIKDQILIGQPYLPNVKIRGKILNHFKEKKKTIFKMKPKKKTRKKQGHRQKLTRVLIELIENI
jgi:large subunit ribosomal protein L21